MARELTPEAVMAEADRIMSVPWQWGAADCCTAACDVFAALWGIDPMADLRGTYDDARGAARVIRRHGVVVAMTQTLAAEAGLLTIEDDGQPGDIGLSYTGRGGGLEGRALLICIRPGLWCGKTLDGYAMLTGAEWGWRCAS